ncbi:electron transfer flavoprotein subunit alpha/FixB family protein [Halobacterium litoreum]|uniref:Electron transfer flavoprotein subunit alpha/FixB family protein n=1 Tax=Halobacterium litoreum TaxID=2039234 RepID=A0ABD5NEW7_9EURY|nr:electron transfer flavoprotein subunit alpha/FixB family protein [Halobacterium litoreum]UHH13528.1 electron transfer flavoprotein subunit alpha/FixB family protein [Halobacterium litoreum]
MTVLTIADHRRGDLRDVSFELLTAGRELADAVGTDLHAAVISGNVEEFADDLNREGVDQIHTVEYGEEFNHDVYAQAVTALTEDLGAEFLLVPNSVNGLDYAPAVATRLGRSYASDAVGLDYDGTLEVTREMYGSKVETTVEVTEGPFVASVRSGEWPAAEGVGDADVSAFDFDVDEDAVGSTVKGFEEVGGGDVDISEANFLVSIGRGIEEEENLELVEALVEATGATLSSSRPIVDNGWLPKNRQVGQSGKQVTPDVYLAIGISGAVQHVAGMKGADTIIAVNTDPNAPIFDIADYGVVGDLFDVVPALIEEFGGEPPSV